MRLTSIPLAAIAAALLPVSANAYLLDDGGLSLATSGSTTSTSEKRFTESFASSASTGWSSPRASRSC